MIYCYKNNLLSEFTIILTYLPKRDELSFLVVLALPNASKIGLHDKILSSIRYSRGSTSALLPP